ncbi:heterokaryon incompatibility protein-domain-containing protein [Hyaloscypha sp. PMI_1271]|nr:heterokaryon incompatibility protein-domain-containing protein [Hyaloscypha sp. PMI_1271]
MMFGRVGNAFQASHPCSLMNDICLQITQFVTYQQQRDRNNLLYSINLINSSPPPTCYSLKPIAMPTDSSQPASWLQFRDQAALSKAAARTPPGNLYQYQPLPSDGHFRILELLPGEATENAGGGVRCRLHTERFADAEDKYAAISYVWGDPNDRVPIICDGRIIEVTINLADALTHIRDRTESRFVWADAICINQEDDTEKGHQVKRMGKVYENAEEVLVWLGSDSEGIAEDCFNLIRDTNEYLDHQLEIYGRPWDMPTITKASPISFDKSRWNKVRTLTKMPWFTRLWVVQEAALAKQCVLLWGNNHLSLAELCELSNFVNYRADFSNLVGQIGTGQVGNNFNTQGSYQSAKSWMRTKPFINAELGNSNTMLFLDVLRSGRGMNSTFGVDRVFAFLGNPLARKHGEEELVVEPDYSKSIQEVYFEVACSLLAHPREAPFLLAYVDHHHNECVEGTTLGSDGAFPSWVPRWDKDWWQYSMGLPHYWYRAGGPERNFKAAVQTDKSLLLPAIIFDHLVWTSNAIHENNIILNPDRWDEDTRTADKPFIDLLFFQVQHAFNKHCHDRYSGVVSANPTSFEDAFGLTLVGHYPAEVQFNLVEHQRNFKAYLQAVRQLVAKHSTSTRKRMRGTARKWLTSFRSGRSDAFIYEGELCYTDNRRFAITESGRFGLVDRLAELNDVCCICPGMTVPLILRPREDGRYGLVGDGYIQGVMAGEVMEQLEKGKVKLENIVLV